MKQLKIIWIIVVVLAVLQIVGGCVYTAWTVKDEQRYTYVDCVIDGIDSVQDGDNYKIESVTVSYFMDGASVSAILVDYPAKIELGATLSGRYAENPTEVSCKTTDWFTPIFLICLGVAYAIGAAVAFVLRKKMGLYAIVDEVGGDEELDDDDWTLLADEHALESDAIANDE